MDPVMALAGLGVGVIVGLTGMGGGALMTPILVLFFGVPPLAAVSSDLAASAVMKPFGGWVHARRGTVNWALVRWLCLGSVPSAFAGVLLMRALGGGDSVQQVVKVALGVALLLAVGGLLYKTYSRRSTQATGAITDVKVRPVPTVLLGALGGLVVGMTSVGSGSLIIVILLALYPMLRANDLVGTDLVQAIPLVAAAALGHAIFGDLQLDLAGAVLLGSVPGVLIGARLSSRAPAGVVRAALIIVLLASALKLFDVPTVPVLAIVGVAVALAVFEGWRRSRTGPTAAAIAAQETGVQTRR
ncbi:sulfite exporter TauE/SafE family protein [Dactylosporangium sp. AC04546]|uniref:sulfite exporter TauE/SafE family protein n=1 Tax=Dactylosporangium sp. AC04546 TaxID=2862460 RepID=UPI001EDD96DB|nr:sulfite exporter TauE/SafE family protein [Dactylosporangium sp. AC04546]WVK79866.1 sulfite exporter TauE/SafE family protein [Dactylosporangium sp. AC04546]